MAYLGNLFLFVFFAAQFYGGTRKIWLGRRLIAYELSAEERRRFPEKTARWNGGRSILAGIIQMTFGAVVIFQMLFG